MINLLSRVGVVLAAFIVFMTSIDVVTAGSRETPRTIHIGIYAPFTHQSAYIGRNILGAMEIARDQLAHPVIHYKFYTLNFSEKEHTPATVQKFIEAHHLDVVVSEGSKAGSLVAPLARKNNLIHFCLGTEAAVADGKNTFQTTNVQYHRGALLSKSMKPEFFARFTQEYFSHPVAEAGYAYDIFYVLNQSTSLAAKNNRNFSSQDVVMQLVALHPGNGIMGHYSLNRKGMAYTPNILTA